MTTPTQHPQWCDPFACGSSDVDVMHESPEVCVGTREFDFGLALVQTQGYAEPEPGDVELRLDVTATAADRPQTACGYLTLDELDSLIVRLTTERERARWMTMPVVHRAVAS